MANQCPKCGQLLYEGLDDCMACGASVQSKQVNFDPDALEQNRARTPVLDLDNLELSPRGGEAEALPAPQPPAAPAVAAAPPPSSSTAVGPIDVPGYQLADEMAPDRWGKVFRATRKKDGKPVEIHVLNPGVLPQPSDIGEFAAKSRELIRLRDNHLVPLVAAGRSGELVYYVLEVPEGEKLSLWLERNRRVPEAACVKIGIGLARALAAAETFGTRHGRIRPDEIWIAQDGTVRLRHSGLAEYFRAKAPALFENPGDLSFASPEEISGGAAAIGSDLHSLGALLFLCASGAVPFQAESLNELRRLVLTQPPPLLLDVSGEFAGLVQKLMAKTAADRPGPAEALVGELERMTARAQEAKPAEPPRKLRVTSSAPSTRRSAATKKKPPVAMIAGIAGGAVVLLILVFGLTSGGPGRSSVKGRGARTGDVGTPEEIGEPTRPSLSKEQMRANAIQALPFFKDTRLSILIKAKEYSSAMTAIDLFEQTYTEIPEEISRLRSEVLEAATKEFEKIRKDALAKKASGEGMQAATSVLEQKGRYAGVGEFPSRLDGLAMGLTAIQTPEGEQGLLAKGESQFAEARDLFVRGHETGSRQLLDDAGFKAEEARIKFQALQDVLPPEPAKKVEGLLKQTIQLTKMINDRKKTLGGGKPVEAKPGAEPTPSGGDETTRPDPGALPLPAAFDGNAASALKQFAAFLSKAVDDPAASGDPASVLARLMAARDDGLVSAAYCVVKMLAAGEWKCVPEESALVKAYAEKFLGEPDKLSQADGFEFLAKGAAAIRGRVPSADLSVSRALALGHLSRLMPPSAELEKKIEGWAGSLGIERGSDGWGCPEGVALARCRAVSKSAGSLKSALEETKAIRSPVWSVFTALSACVLAARAEDLEEAKLAVDLALDELKSINYPGPDTKQDLLWFKTTYGKLKPCKWCKGSNRINCDYGCDENGQVKKMCAVCNGTGNMPHVSDRIPCQAKVPSGTHTWVENCSKCKGTAALSCRSCRAPWAPPSKLASQLFKSGHCQLCGGRGVLLGFLRHPCVDCYGIGERIQVDRKH